VFIAATLFWGGQRPAGAAAASAQMMAVPAYFYPGSYWTQLDQAHPPLQLAVVDPNS
jgi:hypothetical protein